MDKVRSVEVKVWLNNKFGLQCLFINKGLGMLNSLFDSLICELCCISSLLTARVSFVITKFQVCMKIQSECTQQKFHNLSQKAH